MEANSYQAYVAFCNRLGIAPANAQYWQGLNDKIFPSMPGSNVSEKKIARTSEKPQTIRTPRSGHNLRKKIRGPVTTYTPITEAEKRMAKIALGT